MLAFRVPASSQELGAGVRIAAQAPGELHVPDGDAFLAARGLTPGGKTALGSLPVKNVTRGPVNVRLRAREGGHDLDPSLQLAVWSGSRRLASGTLAELRSWSRPVRIERAGERTIHARASIPAGARDTEGRNVDLRFELDARLVKASRL